MTLCEENCKLIEYDYKTKKAKCSCFVKVSTPELKDVKFDIKKLSKIFFDIKNIANINLIKCYKTVFKFKNLIANYGFILYMIIFVIYFISLFIFYCKSYYSLLNTIRKIVDAKIKLFKIYRNNNNINQINKNNNLKNVKNRINKNIKNLFPSKKQKNKNYLPLVNKKNKNKLNKRIYKIKNKGNYIFFQQNIINTTSIGKTNIFFLTKKNAKNTSIIKYNKFDKNIKEYKEILRYNDSELNSLLYKYAKIYDKRTYLQYYFSLIRLGYLFFFSFYCNNDYNSQIIKIFLFFFFFSLDLFINALFFNGDTMHEIYSNEGTYNLIYQISQIIYSTLISAILSKIVILLSLSEDNIIKIKKTKKIGKIGIKTKRLIKTLKIKFSLFFIITFLMLIIFTFYIACFCGIYVNTQIHLIKDTAISFILSLIYPFFLFLIPGLFRIKSLNNKNTNKESLYKFSKLIQNLL